MSLADPHPFENLSPDLVMDAVDSCGLCSDARILALNSYENRVYQVGIEDAEPVVVKFYRPQRWSRPQILEEHAFTWELADLEIPVVSPWRSPEGETLHHFEGFDFALFPRRGGRSPELDNLDHLLILGRFIGRIHRVGALRPFQHRLSLSVEHHGRQSVDFLLQNDFIPASLREAYESLAGHLLERLTQAFADLKPSACIRLHGDCHMGNVLWRDDTPHFVDFDDTLMGPAIQDLWMMLSGERMERMAQLAELVEGYNEFHDFDPRQLHWVEPLRSLRLLHYSAWLARRWDDPAFPRNFPWFNTERYWAEQILTLREQMAALDEPPLSLF